MPRCAITYKDNFWSKTRVDNNVRLDEIADLLGVARTTAGAYFTGFLMPHEEQIETLCEFFDVDLRVGTREFDKMHKAYDVDEKKTLKYSAKSKTKQIDIDTVIKSADADLTPQIEPETVPEIKSDNDIKSPSPEATDVLRILYGKCDYDTFRSIEAMLKGGE